MNAKMLMMSLVAGGCAAVFATTAETTLYVDKNAAAGGDGETPETAFTTIGAALAKAESGWTVRVAPGVYDSESAVDSAGYTNRVYITKKVHLVSTKGKDVTHIVGRKASVSVSSNYAGIGPDAVRCVYVSSGAYGTVVEGFTLRDGACHTTDDNATGYAGGFLGGSNNCRYYAVDCVISNCVGNRAGAIRWGTAVRCRISDNAGGAPAGRVANFANCLITGNDGNLFYDVALANCTVAGNVNGNCFASLTGGYKVYNSVFSFNKSFNGSNTPFAMDGCVVDAVAGFSGLTHASTTLGNSVIRTGEGADDYHFFAPLVNDWRLLPTDAAVGLAKTSNIVLAGFPTADGVDYCTDLDGVSFADKTTINAGAIQTPGPTPATGALQFDVAVSANGRLEKATNLYAFSETAPAAFRVKPVLAEGERVSYIKRDAVHGFIWYPDMNDSFYMLAPPSGVIVTNHVILTTNVIYVATTGNDANSGRDPLLPKKTLQAAADDAPASAVISAAAGTYDEGGVVRNGVSNRLYTTKQIRVVGAGIGKSFIKGAADSDNPSGIAGDGRGPKACRCVCLGNTAAVQGFTLTDGHTDYQNDEDPSDGSTRGGGFSIDSTGSTRPNNRYLLDCMITNCSGRTGGAAYCGTLIRCRIVDCLGTGGGIRYAKLISCVLDHASERQPSNQCLYGGGCSAMQCTFVENADEASLIPNSSDLRTADYVTNSVLYIQNGSIGVTASRIGANVYWGTIRQTSDQTAIEVKGGLVANPLLYRPLAGDGRVMTCSPAIGAGVLDDNSYTWFTSGFGGTDPIFANGRPLAGAFQSLVDTVVVASPKYGSFGTLALTNGVAPGEMLTIQLSDSTRPCPALVVNGVTNATDTASVTVTGRANPSPSDAPVAVEPVYSPHWYVDAVNGNNLNSGFTAVSAKKTMAGVMALGSSLYVGDTIHAAEGVYDDGEMSYGTGATIGTRVVVPAGVALVADGAREKTIIEGKAATDGDELGLGADAVRCVALSDYRSVIRGFTLRGGRTSISGSSNGVDYNGGGVYTTAAATTANAGRVIDCIITNCAAARGGGGYNRIDYINCLFVENRATYGRSGMSVGGAFNCVFTRNRGPVCCQSFNNIVNCTLFDNYQNPSNDLDTTVSYDLANPDANSGIAIYQTIAKGPVKGDSNHYFHASNCLFNATYDNSTYTSKCYYDDATKANITNESFFVFSPDGKLLSQDHPAVDKSSETLNADIAARFSTRMDFETDRAGGQRIYNGRMDLGANEFDWRGIYGSTLGANLAVTSAAPSTVKVGNAVRVSAENALSAVYTIDRPSLLRFQTPVSGTGTLTVATNGCAVASVTSADAAKRALRAPAGDLAISFSYTGDGFADLSGFVDRLGLMVIIR